MARGSRPWAGGHRTAAQARDSQARAGPAMLSGELPATRAAPDCAAERCAGASDAPGDRDHHQEATTDGENTVNPQV